MCVWGARLYLPLTSEMNAAHSATGLRGENVVMMNFGANARFVVLSLFDDSGGRRLREIYCVHQTDILLKNDTQMLAIARGAEDAKDLMELKSNEKRICGPLRSHRMWILYGRAGGSSYAGRINFGQHIVRPI